MILLRKVQPGRFQGVRVVADVRVAAPDVETSPGFKYVGHIAEPGVQKAVELGVSRLVPVLTQHGQVARVNLDRIRANAIEAAEQCGILNLPAIAAPVALARLLADWVPERLMVFCDEEAPVTDPVAVLEEARHSTPPLLGPMPVSVLIGPEGGFAEDERAALLRQPNVVRLSLGPRILRADTAPLAWLAQMAVLLPGT